jgi:hypothetical protein
MKCRHWVVWILRHGKRKPFIIAPDRDTALEETRLRLARFKQPPVLTEPQLCGGAITATVTAVDEPFFGGTSAELEISYGCNQCGALVLPYEFQLPRTESELSIWLTRWVADLQEAAIDQGRDIPAT